MNTTVKVLVGTIGFLIILLGFQQCRTGRAVSRSNELADSLILSEATVDGLEASVARQADNYVDLLSDNESLSEAFREQGARLEALGARQAILTQANVSLTDSIEALAEVVEDTVYVDDSTSIIRVTEMTSYFDDGTLVSDIHCRIPERRCTQQYSLNIPLTLLHTEGPGGSMIATAESTNPNVNFQFDELVWVPPEREEPWCGGTCKKIIGGAVIIAASLTWGDDLIDAFRKED